MRKLLSSSFVIIGLVLIIYSTFLYWQRINPERLSFNIDAILFENSDSIKETTKFPVFISLPNKKQSLSVFPAEIKNSKWDATANGVSYLVTSPIPGSIGNSILYGHNWENILGDLTKVKPGEKIEIIYNDKSSKKFVISHTQVVDPNDVSVLKNTDDVRITIYTCTGFLDSKRFVVTAISEDVNPLTYY